MKRVLLLGASGATGKLLAARLVEMRVALRVLIRESASLPRELLESPLVEIERGNISQFDEARMDELVRDCDALVSCLGHRLTLPGLFGEPRSLVSDSLRKLCRAVERREGPGARLVLMGSTGFTDTLAGERNTPGERLILALMKLLLPPQRDNLMAACHLRDMIGKEHAKIEWVAPRPDTLIDAEAASAYEVFEAPVRSPVFNAGKTSRANVAAFITALLTEEELWRRWQSRFPVLYDK